MNSYKIYRNENFPLSSVTEEIVQKYESYQKQIFIPEYDLLLQDNCVTYNKAVKIDTTFDNVCTNR